MTRRWLIAALVLHGTGCAAHYRFPLSEVKNLDGFDAHKEREVQTVVRVRLMEAEAAALVGDKPFVLTHAKGTNIGFNSKLQLRFELKDGTSSPETTWRSMTFAGGTLTAQPATADAPIKIPEAAITGAVVAVPSTGRTNALIGGIEMALGAVTLLAGQAMPQSFSDGGFTRALYLGAGIGLVAAGVTTLVLSPLLGFNADADY